MNTDSGSTAAQDGAGANQTPALKGRIFRGTGSPHNDIDTLPAPSPWRQFTPLAREQRGKTYQASEREKELVNAALYLRRPLLVTGKPGIGKSSLADAVAYELGLGEVLIWPITTHSTLQQGLYSYDAIGRLQEVALRKAREEEENARSNGQETDPTQDIGHYIR
jgi:hypothetical protein